MATITTNTQLKLINQLSEIDNIVGDDLILVQRGLKSYKSSYNNLINGLVDNTTTEINGGKISVKSTPIDQSQITNNSISIDKLQQLTENTVIGNVSGGSNPEEVQIVQDLNNAGTSNNIASSEAIKNYVTSEIYTIGESDLTSIGNYPTRDQTYQNTSPRKIMVIAIIDGDNDIYGFAAHVAATEAELVGKSSGRDANGRDASTCKAYEYHVSDGGAADATTLIFIVPPNYWFKMTGDAAIKKAEGWEI